MEEIEKEYKRLESKISQLLKLLNEKRRLEEALGLKCLPLSSFEISNQVTRGNENAENF